MRKSWEHNLLQLKENVINVPNKQKADSNWARLLFDEEYETQNLLKLWSGITLPSSGANGGCRISGAISTMKLMGYDTTQAEILFNNGLKLLEKKDIGSLQVITSEIYFMLKNARSISNKDEIVFDTWEKYCDCINFEEPQEVSLDSKDYFERTYSGWKGQIIGGAIGSQLEGYYYKEIMRKYPKIDGYIGEPSLFNDDITFEIAFLESFKEKGYEVTSKDIAIKWIELIPIAMTAEGAALRNLKLGIYPPESALQNNYYGEWIGAQMRGAICGMVAPGVPFRAAKLAWEDGSISHYNNGIIGEIFNALMVSKAYIENDTRRIIEESILMIPKGSHYYSVVNDVMNICLENRNWLNAWEKCDSLFKEYHWVHAYPNIAAEIVSLWYGNSDFDDTLNIICHVGLDVDCNAAQVMNIIGIIVGNDKIHPKWNLDNTLDTYLRGKPKVLLTDLVKDTVMAAKKANLKK